MKRLVAFGLLLVAVAGPAFAQFTYPSWPSVYRLYYADYVSNTISTAIISLNPYTDDMHIYDHQRLYTANRPKGLAACGADLYWIENGTNVYRGRKDGSVAKSSIVSGLGGFADDLALRGGALYISDAYRNDRYCILKADLLGQTVQTFKLPGTELRGLEKAAMNLLAYNVLDNAVYSINFNTGATTLLTKVSTTSFDITVVDTNLIWSHESGGWIYIYKRSLGGGGVSNLVYSGEGSSVQYMDSVDNHVFFGFTFGSGSFLGVAGIRGWAGLHGGPHSARVVYDTGLRGIVVERLNQVKNDFDGDGLADRSVYYPATGQWYVFGTATGFYTDQFGYPGTIPVPGDYDGDGITDYGVFDPATGVWQLFRSSLGYYTTIFGAAGMMPSISDYDNDGLSDICLYNPPNGKWHIIGSTRGYFEDQFGNTFMIPVDTQTAPQY